MKHLIIIVFALFSIIVQGQDIKIKGKYKIEYDQEFNSQNGVIVFNKNTYTRHLLNGIKIKGFIEYQKYFILLKDEKNSLQVRFPKREIKHDTIYFRTKDLNDKPDKEMELTVYAGKLIKIK